MTHGRNSQAKIYNTMETKTSKRYALIYQKVRDKNPGMSHRRIHSATKYLLSRQSYYGNWHKDTQDKPGWIFPINSNTTIRLELQTDGKTYTITIFDADNTNTYLGTLTAKSLNDAKLHAIKICAKHMSHNEHLFPSSWEKLWKLIYQKGGRYTEIAETSPIQY